MSELEKALAAASETERLELGSGVLGKTPTLFKELFGAKRAIVVSDTGSYRVAGEEVRSLLKEAGIEQEEPFVLDDDGLYAESSFVKAVEEVLAKSDAIAIAVGSGTINDLTKLASHRVGRPYICVATAASMDGYTAFGASITDEGLKQTFTCPAPIAVVADIEIIRNAPGHMNAWGYADLLAKVTAGADWILADAVGVEPIDRAVWPIVQSRLRESVSNPDGVRLGETKAVEDLVAGLLFAGFAMQAGRSSRPASGAEHQFSHLWDMQHHTHNGEAPSHGFKVGIGTLASTALYEFLFTQDIASIDIDRVVAEWPGIDGWKKRVADWHGEGDIARGAMREIEAKEPTKEELREQLIRFRDRWPSLKGELQEQLIPFAELKEMLKQVGAPTTPEEIGIEPKRLRESYWPAFSIRRRFTVLDITVRLGLLDEALEAIFGTSGAF